MSTRPTSDDSRSVPDGQFHALVLAGERSGSDAVAAAAGVTVKAFAPLAGREMVLRVLDALEQSGVVSHITLCGPRRDALPRCPELLNRIEGGRLAWVDSAASPSLSAMSGLNTIPDTAPVILTTADHALLTPGMVRHFCAAALETKADAIAGLVEFQRVAAAMPGTRRTVLRFSDSGYCGCNLYAFLSPAGREVIAYWRRGEESRKKPWRMVAELLGPATALSYAAGRLSLHDALERLSRKLDILARAVLLSFPEAAVDVDTPADLELAKRLLAQRK